MRPATLILAAFVFCPAALAERPPQAKSDADFVFDGVVESVDTTPEGGVDYYLVAVKITKVHKGDLTAGNVFKVSCFQVKKFKPGTTGAAGHYAIPAKGDKIKAYATKYEQRGGRERCTRTGSIRSPKTGPQRSEPRPAPRRKGRLRRQPRATLWSIRRAVRWDRSDSLCLSCLPDAVLCLFPDHALLGRDRFVGVPAPCSPAKRMDSVCHCDRTNDCHRLPGFLGVHRSRNPQLSRPREFATRVRDDHLQKPHRRSRRSTDGTDEERASAHASIRDPSHGRCDLSPGGRLRR